MLKFENKTIKITYFLSDNNETHNRAYHLDGGEWGTKENIRSYILYA